MTKYNVRAALQGEAPDFATALAMAKAFSATLEEHHPGVPVEMSLFPWQDFPGPVVSPANTTADPPADPPAEAADKPKARRGRPPKDAAPEAAAPAPEPNPPAPPAQEAPETAAAAPEPAITSEDLRRAVQAAIAAGKGPNVKTLLSELKADSVSAVPDLSRAGFLAAVQALVAPPADDPAEDELAMLG